MLLYFRYLGKAVCYIPDNCPLALYSSPLRGMDPHSPGLFCESLLRMLHYRCPTPPRISILRQLKNLSQKLDMMYLKKGKSFFFKLMSIDRTRKINVLTWTRLRVTGGRFFKGPGTVLSSVERADAGPIPPLDPPAAGDTTVVPPRPVTKHSVH